MLETLFTTEAMRAVFADGRRIQRMLDFEAALARAEAATGVIPAAAAASIVRCCRAETYDFAALRAAARNSGNLAIPLVAALTAEVARLDATSRGFVHWGATSQDVLDTGLVLQLRDALIRSPPISPDSRRPWHIRCARTVQRHSWVEPGSSRHCP
jgi:3-carboxy-cis,cis-muconate cycloisomerase